MLLPPPPSQTLKRIFLSRSRTLLAGEIQGLRISTFFSQVLSRKFDHGEPASALSEMQNFDAPNNTPYKAYYRAFRMVSS